MNCKYHTLKIYIYLLKTYHHSIFDTSIPSKRAHRDDFNTAIKGCTIKLKETT